MKLYGWSVAGAALLVCGCMHQAKVQSPEEASLVSEQQRSSAALKNAADAQDDANKARAKADSAHEAVLNAQAALSTAETQWRDSELEAKQAQRRAREANRESQQVAQGSQQQALQEEQQVQEQHAKEQAEFHERDQRINEQKNESAEKLGREGMNENVGEGGSAEASAEVAKDSGMRGLERSSVEGTLSQANNDRIRIREPSSKELTLRVTPKTEILLNGEHGDLAQLPKGADVRADYDFIHDRPTAIRVEVTSKALFEGQ